MAGIPTQAKGGMKMMNTDSFIDPVWQLKVNESDTFLIVRNNSKYHCFEENKSLCGAFVQNTSDYDYGISMESASVLERPDRACKRCLKKWKRFYQVGG